MFGLFNPGRQLVDFELEVPRGIEELFLLFSSFMRCGHRTFFSYKSGFEEYKNKQMSPLNL